MAPVSVTTVALLLILLPAACVAFRGGSWWLQQPYEDDDNFNSLVKYGRDVILHCDDPDIKDVDYWMLPDLSLLTMARKVAEYYTFDGLSSTKWAEAGKQLNVTLLVEQQFGFYYCYGNGKVHKQAINYNGPYFGDTWPDYRMNTIVGCVSAAVFLVISLIIWAFVEWKCGGDDDHTQDDDYNHNTDTTAPYDPATDDVMVSKSAAKFEATTVL